MKNQTTGSASKPFKITPKRHSLSQQRANLLASSSDGIEASCSGSSNHSCGSISGTICMHHQRQVLMNNQHHAYINSNDSIFAVESSGYQTQVPTVSSSNGYLQHQSNDSMLAESSSINSLSSTNFESLSNEPLHTKQLNPPTLSQQQQQHRRLQYQVHQQLQRIYGSQVSRPKARMLYDNGQSQPQESVARFSMKQNLRQQLLVPDHRREEQVNFSQNLIDQKQQSRGHQMDDLSHNQCPSQNHLHQAKQSTRDYQDRACRTRQDDQDQTYDLLCPTTQNSRDRASEDFYEVAGNFAHRHRDASISAIPEESPDLEANEDEDLLLSRVASKPIDRKGQLQSLHYATVTAAALLNATANAAAAFAVGEKELQDNCRDSHQQPRRLVGCSNHQLSWQDSTKFEQQANRGPLYSDLHLCERKARSQSEPYRQLIADGHRHPQEMHYTCRAPVYANPADQNHYHQLESRPKLIRSAGPLYHPPIRAQQRLRPQHVNQKNPFAPLASKGHPMSRPIPGRPVAMIPPNKQAHLANQAAIIQHAVQIIKQQHQRNQMILHRQQRLANQPIAAQQVIPTPLPALAILPPANKNAVDVIGKVMMSNALNQNQRPQSHNQSNLAQYVQLQNLVGIKNASNDQLITKDNLKNHVFGVPSGPILPVVAVPNTKIMPLKMRNQLKPLGCLDRICRIDLTLFWWSLLLVAVGFVCAVITISRYVF